MTSFIKGEEEIHDNYQRKVYENLQHNQRRRMQLQNDLQFQQNHRLSKTAWLQSRWLEVSEQERRAQIHNQKLLLDFQKAQDTLNDMVARTEAMNTIRVQYEQYLEENFPRWQQRLKDKRVSEKSKRVQQHLSNYIQQMEEDEAIKTAQMSDFRDQPLSCISPDPLQTSHSMLNAHRTTKDIKQNSERMNHHSYFPPTWLTGSQPFISGLPQNNFPKDYKNLQNSQALNHPLPPFYSLPGNSLHQSNSPVEQQTPSMDHMWARQGFVPTAHFTPAGVPWPQLPVLNPMMWGMMDVPNLTGERIECSETDKEKVTQETPNPNEESCLSLKHARRNGKETDRSSELDCRPVRLSVDHEGSSEGSPVPSEVMVSGMQKRRKKTRDRTKSLSTENRNTSQSSSTTPQDASESHSDTQISKTHQTPSKKYSSKESIITERNADAVMQDEDKQDKSRSQEIPQNSVNLGKRDGSEGLNIREEEDSDKGDDDRHDIIVKEEEKSNREVEEEDEEGSDEEKEAGLDDEAPQDDEEGGKKVIGRRDGIEASDNKEPAGEGDVQTLEEEDKENSFQDETEDKNTQARVEENIKDNTSERDLLNSHEESYADDAEEEEVYNQEIEDDDDDDEVVVEKAHLWSRDPFDDHTKCPDDYNDDIEGLLNPANSHTQKEDDVEETDQSNDLHSGSDEKNLPQKKHPTATHQSAESDDEFDHFYD